MNKDLIEKVIREVRRADFVLPKYYGEVGIDAPLPIGFGQTISQPTTVKMMLEWLNAKTGDKVLDVGSGSGWTTALLSNIVGEKGGVYAVERVPELKEFGEKNCAKAGIKNAKFYLADKKIFGLSKFAPYDRILVSASAQELPQELIEQLKIDGKLVVPVGDSILEISKKTKDDIDIIEHYGFVFVPLIK
jgi:protein-L-isoaspartate(D-aspartate) O-methyltransferase